MKSKFPLFTSNYDEKREVYKQAKFLETISELLREIGRAIYAIRLIFFSPLLTF